MFSFLLLLTVMTRVRTMPHTLVRVMGDNTNQLERDKGLEGMNRPHPVFPVPAWSMEGGSNICNVNIKLWDCLGSDRDWGLVSLVDKEGEGRLNSVNRLLNSTKLLVVEATNRKSLPVDFLVTGTRWRGRKCISSPGRGGRVRVLVRGDLDEEGKVFSKVVSDWGESKSSKKLLTLAAMYTSGDILEVGTEPENTALLHTVVKQGVGRMLVTADSNSVWLTKHSDLIRPFHQFVFVPLYNERHGCRQEEEGRDAHSRALGGHLGWNITCQVLAG